MTIHHTTNAIGSSIIIPTSSQHVEYVEMVGPSVSRELLIDASMRSKAGILELGITFASSLNPQAQIAIRDASRSSGTLRLTTESGAPLTTESGETLTTEGDRFPELVTTISCDGIQPNAYLRMTVDPSGHVQQLLRAIPAF